jgi:hypothetical protein
VWAMILSKSLTEVGDLKTIEKIINYGKKLLFNEPEFFQDRGTEHKNSFFSTRWAFVSKYKLLSKMASKQKTKWNHYDIKRKALQEFVSKDSLLKRDKWTEELLTEGFVRGK